MIIRLKAPFRLEFSGDGTDVPPYTDEHGGIIFNATIDNYTYCSITSRKDDEIKVHSLDFDTIVHFKNKLDLKPDESELDLVKAVINRMTKLNTSSNRGMDVVLHSDIPPGSGLGSSSMLCVDLVRAIARFYAIPLTRQEIAKLAYEIERIDLCIAGGLQDQCAAAFGGFNLLEFHKNLKVLVNSLRIPQDIKNELLYHLILINTGKSRMSDGILRKQVNILQNNPENVLSHYRSLKEIAIWMKNYVIAGEVKKFDLLKMHGTIKNKFVKRYRRKGLKNYIKPLKTMVLSEGELWLLVGAVT